MSMERDRDAFMKEKVTASATPELRELIERVFEEAWNDGWNVGLSDGKMETLMEVRKTIDRLENK